MGRKGKTLPSGYAALPPGVKENLRPFSVCGKAGWVDTLEGHWFEEDSKGNVRCGIVDFVKANQYLRSKGIVPRVIRLLLKLLLRSLTRSYFFLCRLRANALPGLGRSIFMSLHPSSTSGF